MIYTVVFYVSYRSLFSDLKVIFMNLDTSMGMPASSRLSDDSSSIIEVMYFSVLAVGSFSSPHPRKTNMTYDVHRPYDELLPSHIRGKSVNTQKWFTTSSTPLHGSFVHFPTIFPSKTHKTMQKSSKRLKIPPKGLKYLQKAIKPSFPLKISKIPPKKQKGIKNIK